MNKLIFKVMFAVLAFVTVGLGSYKMYSSYKAANMSEDELLMMENVLALSENHSSQCQIAKHPVYRVVRYVKSYAWDDNLKKNVPVYGYRKEKGYYQTCNTLGENEAKMYPVCQNDVCTNYECAKAKGWTDIEPKID